MAINIANYLKEKYNEYDSTIDTSSGSGVYDLFINPLNQILETFDSQNSNLISRFSKLSINDMTDDDMQYLGNAFLLSKISGTKAYGEVTLQYSAPTSVIIPSGTILSSGTRRFETVGNYSFSQNSLTYVAPYYNTPSISIVAVDYGYSYNLPANSSFVAEGYISKVPTKIYNSATITSGVDSENNYDFYERLKTSVFGQFLSSPIVIENYLKSLQPTIKNVDIVGINNPLMLRDKVYDISSDGTYNKADFQYVRSGSRTPLLDKTHKAYYGQFSDSNSGVGIGFPSNPSAWSTEFTDAMYKNMYRYDDLNYASTTETSILEAFTSGSNLPVIGKGSNSELSSDGWKLKDGASADNNIVRYDDITAVNGALRLGINTNTSDDILKIQEQIKELKAFIASSEGFGSSLIEAKKELTTLIDSLALIVESNIYHNPSPVVAKQIDTHTGIKIEVSAATTDGTDDGNLSYINVFKNNLIVTPYDGFGAAWKKQPEYLIRLDKNEYPSNSDKTLKEDLAKFLLEYKVNGNAFRGKISGLRGTIHPDAKSKIWKYNVFIVDNNLLEDEVWVSSEQIWNQASGRDQFLSAGKFWIEQNVEYAFKIEINENMGTKVWVNPDDNITPVVTFGPNSPNYIPDSNNTITTGSGDSQRNQIGIGVINTSNYEWYYKNLTVIPILNVFPGHLFKMDVSSFTPTSGISYNYSGFAFNSELLEAGHSSLQLAVFNQDTQLWEVLGTNTNEPPEISAPYNYANNKITGSISNINNYISSNYIYFAAMPTDDTIDLHELRSYYFEINDGEYTGINKGNAIDIYVNDPDNIVTESFEDIVTNQEIDFTDNVDVNGFVQEIVDVAESYSNISINKSEWAIINSIRGRGLVYSSRNKFKLVFNSDSYNNTKLRITYKYWNKGNMLSNFIQDSSVRQPAVDYVLKVSPPASVVIEQLLYSGNVVANDMKLFLLDYINSLDTKKLEKSDIVNFMYSKGATYVDLDMTITINLYDTEMNLTKIDFTAQSYTIPTSTISRFNTTISNLYGVEII